VRFGLQFGGQAAEVVILVNSQKGIDRLLTRSLKLGAEASVAAGPVGIGQAANLTATSFPTPDPKARSSA
jgi:lipid-binding SYLF domain-containing protein